MSCAAPGPALALNATANSVGRALLIAIGQLIIPSPRRGMGSCFCVVSSSLLLSHSPRRGMGSCFCVVSSSLLLLSA